MAAIPLYLQDSDIDRLELDNANRLRVARESQADLKIPLRFISRIICKKGINISTDVLVACMKLGIPISIVDRKGETLGWCMGVLRRESTLQNLLIHALDDPEWEIHYKGWFSDQYMATVAQVLLMCDIPATPIARSSPRTVMFNRHRQKHGVPCGKLVNRIACLAQEELAAKLHDEIGDPSLLSLARPGVNLITDMASILALYVHTDIHHTVTIPTAKDLGPWATRHYQKHSTHWKYRISPLVFSFSQFLRHHWL